MTFAMSDSRLVALNKHRTWIEVEVEALAWGNNRYTTNVNFSEPGGPRDTSVLERARIGGAGFRRVENLAERDGDRRGPPLTQ